MRPAPPIPSIDVSEAHRRLASEADLGPLLVDVRERDEFATVRVPGAVLMPLSEFEQSWEKLPRDCPLLLMCASGRRSLAASEHLARNDYRDVANVEGGIIAWQRAGYPTLGGPPGPGEGELERSG